MLTTSWLSPTLNLPLRPFPCITQCFPLPLFPPRKLPTPLASSCPENVSLDSVYRTFTFYYQVRLITETFSLYIYIYIYIYICMLMEFSYGPPEFRGTPLRRCCSAIYPPWQCSGSCSKFGVIQEQNFYYSELSNTPWILWGRDSSVGVAIR
jgi:hypothetical protein